MENKDIVLQISWEIITKINNFFKSRAQVFYIQNFPQLHINFSDYYPLANRNRMF